LTLVMNYQSMKAKVSPNHPWLALGNLTEGVIGVIAIGCGIYALIVYGSAMGLVFSLLYSITTTVLAFKSAWVLR